ncbi:hypothetical protein DASC09_043570 [Saccharomycopsis crataegensis]|uniref:Uncharacterized protein n=1 Tax=Saccharomycopsis crataegensis TaxID=43959 RepID=A0AAV5QQ92_9ASCO|nr:hypothetical protein DASC09_043570 [Saccharomycopsis crataegensis]
MLAYFGINKIQIESTLKVNNMYPRIRNHMINYANMPLDAVPNLRGESLSDIPNTLSELGIRLGDPV